MICFTTAKIYFLSSSEYCQWNENQNTIHGLTHDINSMPKLLYTWYFEKFTASVTSCGHSALRHEVSRICTILAKPRFAIHPQGIRQFHDNYKIANCQTVATLAPVYIGNITTAVIVKSPAID